ncbi:MAG: hypothetical protein EOP11_18335 [Proteobacteria bacterium]|nr:MAG: hypothetical protein EOP11_18335 [Pseudomonadota bacterium]
MLASLLSPAAFAGRSPPRAMGALVVEKTFTAKAGEMQFLVSREGHTIYLRTDSGLLYTLSETRGPRDCDEYLAKEKDGERLPLGCEFQMKEEASDRMVTVRSEDMREGGLILQPAAKAGEINRYVSL